LLQEVAAFIAFFVSAVLHEVTYSFTFSLFICIY